MNKNAMFEKDLLYPTANISEPGSIHVEILNPNKNGRMPVVIESKTSHSPVEYITSIMQIIQGDIFDRIHVDVKANVQMYLKLDDEIKSQYGDKKYLMVVFDGERIDFKAIDDIEA